MCSMTARTLNLWLIKFVQDICDKDGGPYPARTVAIPNYVLVEAIDTWKKMAGLKLTCEQSLVS